MNLRSPLDRYRLLAYIVGTGLVILFFVGVPLQHYGHPCASQSTSGSIHGFLYIVYVITVLELGLRYR